MAVIDTDSGLPRQRRGGERFPLNSTHKVFSFAVALAQADSINQTWAWMITSFKRSIGDDKTHLDRREPELNETTPGDAGDTTTPIAIARGLKALLLDHVLSTPGRNELTQWMLREQVADCMLRAGSGKLRTNRGQGLRITLGNCRYLGAQTFCHHCGRIHHPNRGVYVS